MKVYGDAVVLVLKSGDVVSRLNAIVLASSLHAPMTLDRKPIKDAEPVEHLDLAYPAQSLAPGGILKTRNFDEIFRNAYSVGPYGDGLAIGYEELPVRTAEGFELPPLGELTSSESLFSRQDLLDEIENLKDENEALEATIKADKATIENQQAELATVKVAIETTAGEGTADKTGIQTAAPRPADKPAE